MKHIKSKRNSGSRLKEEIQQRINLNIMKTDKENQDNYSNTSLSFDDLSELKRILDLAGIKSSPDNGSGDSSCCNNKIQQRINLNITKTDTENQDNYSSTSLSFNNLSDLRRNLDLLVSETPPENGYGIDNYADGDNYNDDSYGDNGDGDNYNDDYNDCGACDNGNDEYYDADNYGVGDGDGDDGDEYYGTGDYENELKKFTQEMLGSLNEFDYDYRHPNKHKQTDYSGVSFKHRPANLQLKIVNQQGDNPYVVENQEIQYSINKKK